jgi:GNAT superfamily N-acetyltransferase
MIQPTIRPAETKDLPSIQMLAKKIWPDTYGSILPAGQLEYMLEQIYSPESLYRQMQESHHVFLIVDYDSRPSGFASYSIDVAGKKGKLHKIYIDQELQGKGLGKYLLEDVTNRVRSAGCSILQLDVNRRNKARSFYEKQGFKVMAEKDTDIGNGFWMTDYVMEREIVDGGW